MAQLRWWAEKVGKYHMIPHSNRELGLPDRHFNPANKAQELNRGDFERISNKFLRYSVMLQQAFGLRREESIKFIPSYADKGHYIRLKGSWTKGGRPRKIPITHCSQRELLDDVKRIAKGGSLIPKAKLYRHQLSNYDDTTQRLGFRNLHGLRHGYAQRRYEVMTGWKCPKNGGPTSRQMTEQEYAVDQRARLKVSQELGHNRIEITRTYLG